MVHSLYWISTLVYAYVLLIIYANMNKNRKPSSETGKAFNLMLKWVMFFCVQDSFWGLCGARVIEGDNIFFISSTIFHLSTVFTTYFWLKYVLTFLGDRIKHKKIYIAIDTVIILFQIVLLVINIFTPTIFTIKSGIYVTENLRTICFLNQYIVYFVIGVVTFLFSFKEKSENRDSFLSVFLFSLAPILSGIFQLLYPDGPFYSIGYFLGCFVVHIFIVSTDKLRIAQSTVLTSVANIYYSLQLLDLKEDSVEKMITSDYINSFIDKNYGIQGMLTTVMHATVTDEYIDEILEFTKLDTLQERIQDKNVISREFIGKHFGWTRISFMPVERDEKNNLVKVMLGIQIIDSEKRHEQELINKSNTDQLTGFYNRRAYEEQLVMTNGIPNNDNFVYLSLDVNGLKIVNDSLGHNAGDDLLRGAAYCIKQAFGEYGKLYRMGGDEFSAILNIEHENLESIISEFNKLVRSWKGDLVDSLSISLGYASKYEYPYEKIVVLANIADERMYEAKSAHYRDLGVDRKGQAAAHTALCNLYTKILKINLTKDSYHIVNMDTSEQSKDKGFSDKISEWLSGFGRSGFVHPDDLDIYLQETDTEYLSNYFRSGKTSISIHYRRKYTDGYKHVVMDMIPANDYTDDNQSLFLYVKDIDK